jgi:hypothetical protein
MILEEKKVDPIETEMILEEKKVDPIETEMILNQIKIKRERSLEEDNQEFFWIKLQRKINYKKRDRV